MPSSWQLCTTFIVLLILYRVHSLEIIEAHLIPHSHCDPGWLQTYEGYYHAKVSHILTNVVAELLKNSTRTFVWSEVSFFSLWYDSQPEEVRANTRKLIENKQFEFVGGGWVQHDEANALYHQVVDQLTVGHRYLWENFKVKPNMAWQIDPFGHSSLTPTALALAGFDAVVLNRVHYATKKELTRNQHLEFLWHSHTRPELKVLAHVLKGSYMSTYDFENSDLPDKMEIEGPSFATKYIRSRAEYYRTNVVMIPWGNDFRFVKAERQYSRMDPLIDYVNAHPELGVRVQYSTLSRYFAAVHRAGAEFPSYAGDFFPYADTERAYWTGYYTTQPSLKLYSRQVDAVIRAADIALTLANHHAAIPEVTGQIIFDIVSNSAAMTLARQEAALILHHDAITGTAKSAVLNDYMRRLNSAYYAAKDVLSDALSVLLTGHEGSPRLDSEISVLDFNYKKEHVIVLYNSLAWNREQFYRLTVRTLTDIHVNNSRGELVPYQFIPADPTSSDQHYHLYFKVSIAPLAAETYYLTALDSSANIPPMEVYRSKATYYVDSRFNAEAKIFDADHAAIENEVLRVVFSPTNGMIERVLNKMTGESIAIQQDLLAYQNSVKSGAYLMKTEGAAKSIVDGFLLVLVKGEYVQEARVIMNSGIEWQIRVYSGLDSMTRVIEQHYKVRAESGNEVIVRYNTNIDDTKYFYTDNGLEVLRRQKTDDVPEHNYYPGVSLAYVQSEEKNQRFTVLNQHAMGVTSLQPGTLELMLHRNLPNDDERGIGEGNNDQTTVSATLWSLWHTNEVSEISTRQLSIILNNPLMALTTKDRAFEYQVRIEDWKESFESTYRPMKDPLPDNMHMATFQHLSDGNILLRLVNTEHQVNEGQLDTLSNVQQLFTVDSLHLIEEQLLASTGSNNVRMEWKSAGLSNLSKIELNIEESSSVHNEVQNEISLRPCETRTFIVQLGTTAIPSSGITNDRPKLVTKPKLELQHRQKELHPDMLPIYFVAFLLTVWLISSFWRVQSKSRKLKTQRNKRQ